MSPANSVKALEFQPYYTPNPFTVYDVLQGRHREIPHADDLVSIVLGETIEVEVEVYIWLCIALVPTINHSLQWLGYNLTSRSTLSLCNAGVWKTRADLVMDVCRFFASYYVVRREYTSLPLPVLFSPSRPPTSVCKRRTLQLKFNQKYARPTPCAARPHQAVRPRTHAW